MGRKEILVVIDEAQSRRTLTSLKDVLAYIPVATNGIDTMSHDMIAFRNLDDTSTPTESVYLQFEISPYNIMKRLARLSIST